MTPDPAAPAWFPPLAPLPARGGTTFRVVARAAPEVRLLLYAAAGDVRPARTIVLNAAEHRHGDVWEVFLSGVGPGQHYCWELEPDTPLLDPCALAVSGPARFPADDPGRQLPPLARRNRDAEFKSVVIAPPQASRARGPRTPLRDAVLYELHVRGFTRRAGRSVEAPGTYRGLADKAAYLRELGVTTVELLPVHEFDETVVRGASGLVDFWGYSPIAWFSPNRRYAARAGTFDGPLLEFREMVEAFHAEGLDVVVDVVFNHTGELDRDGPVWNLRGLDAERYYLHDTATGEPLDLTGCGNTVRAGHATASDLILCALRWWVHGLGVDGFRFDLASILARGGDGVLLKDPPLIRAIENDPWLQGVHLVAEAWDAADGYLVGSWPGGPRWAVWNDRFRDGVRRAWLSGGDDADPAELARRLTGSNDLFPAGPARSLNFVTAHDGFTLLDAVSYSRRHNESNGERGLDGNPHEISANHGCEGPAHDPAILAARDRSRRNLVATLLLAHGVPMLLGGDERGRTQRGNNNAYCHDDATSWVDWEADDAAFARFVRGLVQLRRSLRALRRETFLRGDDGDVTWFGPRGGPVDWETPGSPFGYRLSGRREHTGADADEPDLIVLVACGDAPARFELPDGPTWIRIADTAAAPPRDFDAPRSAPRVPAGEALEVAPRSLVVLLGEP